MMLNIMIVAGMLLGTAVVGFGLYLAELHRSKKGEKKAWHAW